MSLLYVSGSVFGSGLTVSTAPEVRVLKTGENIRLPCVITGPGFNPWTNFIIWEKILNDGQAVSPITQTVLIESADVKELQLYQYCISTVSISPRLLRKRIY